MSDKIITEEMVEEALTTAETWRYNTRQASMRAIISAILPDIAEAFARIAEETDVEEWTGDNGGRETGSPEENANKIAAAIRAAAKGDGE